MEELVYSVITWSVNNEEYVSAAPRNWINDENNSCLWPKNKKIERKAINLRMKPEEDWNKLKNITIVGHYATLAEANEVEKRKTKATSESDAATVEDTQKRKITKNKKYRDDSISPPPIIKPAIEQHNNPTPENSASPDSSPLVCPVKNLVPEKNIKEESDDAVSHGCSEFCVELDPALTPADIRRAQIVFQDDDEILSLGQSQSETSSAAACSTDSLTQQLSQVMTELKNLKSIAIFTMHRVEHIEDTLKRVRVPSQRESSPPLLPNLPLMELCQLKSLEEKMTDEQFEKQLFNMLRYTGGSRERDCVNRCLEKIFTNYLAQFCSWTGKKNNFKLSSLKIITTLKLAVRESFPNITDDGFERHVMCWFQHAATRLKRQT